MTVWFVSRHVGAVEWMKAVGRKVDFFVPHLDIDEVQEGDVVIGTLPIYLAAEVCGKGAEFYFLQLPQKMHLRGSEYTAEEMVRMGACLHRFSVSVVKEDGL